jgi:hypothetical protein
VDIILKFKNEKIINIFNKDIIIKSNVLDKDIKYVDIYGYHKELYLLYEFIKDLKSWRICKIER